MWCCYVALPSSAVDLLVSDRFGSEYSLICSLSRSHSSIYPDVGMKSKIKKVKKFAKIETMARYFMFPKLVELTWKNLKFIKYPI